MPRTEYSTTITAFILAVIVKATLISSVSFNGVIANAESVDPIPTRPFVEDATDTTKSPPNIVLVMADDLGFRDIGYQDSDINTPFLDDLAQAGVKLDNYYVQYQCAPTRSQLMSGRYQIHTGLQNHVGQVCQWGGLPLRFPTVAEMLKEAGYATHLIGKWHLGFSHVPFTPLFRGFDTFYGNLPGFSDHYNWSSCDITWTDVVATEPPTGVGICGYSLTDMMSPAYSAYGTYSTYAYTQRAIQIVQGAAGQKKPFFLYLSYQAPHSHIEAPGDFLNGGQNIVNLQRRIYAGMVKTVEAGVWNLTQALKREGLWENTVFIFSSDNGAEVELGGNNWPLRGNKGSLWEGGIRTVGFVTSPLLKSSQKGTVTSGLIHVTDWFPTLAEIAGATVNESLELDGVSQWATIRDGAPSKRKEILHNINEKYALLGDQLYNDTFDNRVQAAIRIGDYKLLTGDPGDGTWYQVQNEEGYEPQPLAAMPDWNRNSTKNIWLFNIARDPNETTDLSESMPEKVKAMLDRLAAYNATSVPIVSVIMDENCDPTGRGGFWHPWVQGWPQD